MKFLNLRSKIGKWLLGLILLCHLLYLTSCVTPQALTKTQIVYVPPPPVYLMKYPVPKIRGNKNRDLLDWALELRELNEKHNEDKQALVDWTKEVSN